jgi:beta-galactosidase
VDNQTSAAASFNLVSEIRDAKGKKVFSLSTSCTLPKNAKKSFTQKGRIPKAVLWSLENPHLYTWTVRVEKGRQTLDQVDTSFGVRSFRFDANKGFFLNGKPVKIKGTCNHQDFAGVGIAIPDRLFTYRLEKLKEMGSNAYRCSHNPPAPELLDECDRLGILVMDENRRLGDTDEILSQVESMVLRDRNHPSIFMWSLCNEEPLQGKPEGKKHGQAMKKVILGLDKTRLISCAMNYDWGPGGLSDIVDVQGFNYAIDQYEPYHAKHPKMALYGSETASTVSTRGIYETDRKLGYVSAYDVNHTEWAYTAEAAWRPIALRPWMAGGFVWTGFDYRGEPTPYGWPCINSHFGILDMCGFPKDNFYYYQAWWGDKPVLHLLPHWNWKGWENRQIDVWCQTNYDLVELFLNGKSLGKQETPRYGHLEWKVWWEPGVLTAKAYNKGVFMEETSVETTGEPVSIRLKPYVTQLMADGEDTTPIAVEILDEKGRVVPVADNEVTFTVTGAGHIAGVANGDPSSHEPDKADKRKAFNGMCMVLIGANETPGEITLIAKSNGLKQATFTLHSLAP